MKSIEEVNLESILPSNGPSINEVKKYLEKVMSEVAPENQINWKDNIPIISYFLRKGNCQKCKTNIGSKIIITEIKQ